MQDNERSFRSGFCALVGRPNVGKSTLVNACLGEKLAITSPVAQTTRKRLRAVINSEDAQIIIVDTPGLHKPKDALGKELNQTALGELADADVVAYLVDATAPVGTGDAWVAKHVDASDAPFKLLVITKADLASQAEVIAQLEKARGLASFDDELVISSTDGFNVDTFLDIVKEHLPEGPHWFPEDMGSDATDEEIVAEFVREKLLLNLRQEVPHSVAVVCDDIEFSGDRASISATIIVEREGQKGIVVGAGGSMIKRVGTEARKDLEYMFGCKVYLDLNVKVAPLWRRDANEIRRLGYSSED